MQRDENQAPDTPCPEERAQQGDLRASEQQATRITDEEASWSLDRKLIGFGVLV